MIGNIQSYIRNVIGMVVSFLLIYIFLQFVFFRGLMSYLYDYPYWKQLFYSFGDMYAVITDIHQKANSLFIEPSIRNYALKIITVATLIFGFCSFLIVLVVYSIFSKLMPTDLHQEKTRFANYRELKRAGLFKAGGAIIAGYRTWTGKVIPVTSCGEEHVYMESTTGTGKSVAGAIPTALSWTGSMIANDNKGEICEKSSGYRSKELKQRIIKLFLSVISPVGAYFNPLLEMRICSYSEEKDIHKLGLILGNLSDAEYEDSSNPNVYFVRAPIHFIIACIIHCLYTKEQPTMRDVVEMVSQRDINALMETVLSTNHIETIKSFSSLTEKQRKYLEEEFAGETTHPTVKKAFDAMAIVIKSEKQFAGLIDSVRTMLQIFYDPLIQKITSKSTFRIQDIVDDYDATTLYIIFEPSDQVRISVITRMIFEMASQYMIRDGNKPTFRHKLLLLLDEMKQLGKLSEVQRNMEIGRSAGIKVYAILQEKKQLEEIYGENQIITSQSQIKITYTPNVNSVKFIQEYMVGNTERAKKTVSTSSDSGARNSTSESSQNEEKPILSMQQLLNLPIIRKKNILINYLDKINQIPKKKYKLTNDEWSDIRDILRKINLKFPQDHSATELYQYFIRNIDVEYISEDDYQKLINNQNFIDFISRPLEKEIAIKPGDVIINVSTLRPFRQYRGTQFCYMFDKEFLRRSKIKMDNEESPREIVGFVYGK